MKDVYFAKHKGAATLKDSWFASHKAEQLFIYRDCVNVCWGFFRLNITVDWEGTCSIFSLEECSI